MRTPARFRTPTHAKLLPQRIDPMPDAQREEEKPSADTGLRRLMIWVFGALILTVLFAILVVEVTLRYFGER